MTSPGFTGSLPDVGAAALAWAVRELDRGVCEVGGNNRGPDVDTYLADVKLPPGEPWCCAFVVMGIKEGAGELGVPYACPMTGSCIRLWERAPNARVAVPRPGDVYVLQHGPLIGHAGFVETVDTALSGLTTVATEISGNTFAKGGGRAGNCVARHMGPPAKTHGGVLLGYLRF